MSDPIQPVVLSGAMPPGIRHGFFTRIGGVSEGPFASLNCSITSGDDPARLDENRRIVARWMETPDRLLGLSQVHGRVVDTVREPRPAGQGPRADAMVTDRAGIALGIITADCAPVLFAGDDGRVVGAAHAGWRGAAGGVLEETLAAMRALGAVRVRALVGPCIGRGSYEVGPELRDAVAAAGMVDPAPFFSPGRGDRLMFDLSGYCVARLRAAGAEAEALGGDTCADERHFFSHRRRTLAGGGPIGHQISAIAIAAGRA